jgi:CBS domain-containing membrane protein
MHSIKVAEIMSSPVVTLQADHGIGLAEGVMRFQHIRHLPVVDEHGSLVGLITHRDLVKTLSYELGKPIDLTRHRGFTIPVRRIMQSAVWTVTPLTPVLEAARILRDHKIGCLPVIENKRVVGIVTAEDFLMLLTRFLETRRDREDTDPEIRLRNLEASMR